MKPEIFTAVLHKQRKASQWWDHIEHITVPDDLEKPHQDQMALCGRPMEYGGPLPISGVPGARGKPCEKCNAIKNDLDGQRWSKPDYRPSGPVQLGRGSQMRGWRLPTKQELESLRKLTSEDVLETYPDTDRRRP